MIRLRRMAAEGALAFPVIAAHDTAVKRLVEGTCGTGQSVIDGILRATNTLLAGKTMVVAGFGPSGRGVAERARGLGAQVIVTEINPVRALDASLRGFRVLPMAQAAPLGEVFVTATGSCDVITADHLNAMRDGAILANAGHFDVEIDVRALTELRRKRCTPACGRTWTPTTWATAGPCCCWPRAGWSTWSPPRAIRRR